MILLETFKTAASFSNTKSSPIICIVREGGFEFQSLVKSAMRTSKIKILSGISISKKYLSLGKSFLRSR